MESVYHWHGDVTEKMTVVMTTILTNTTAKMLVNVCTRIIRRVSQLERELLTLPEHMSSPPVLSGVRVTRSFVLCVYLEIVVCPFVLFCCWTFVLNIAEILFIAILNQSTSSSKYFMHMEQYIFKQPTANDDC
jgi:hypothetical protein